MANSSVSGHFGDVVLWCYTVGLYVSTGSTAGINPAILSWVPLVSLNDPAKTLVPQGKAFQPGQAIPSVQNSRGKLIPLHDIPQLFDYYIQMLNDSKCPNSPILEGNRQFLQDFKNGGIPYTEVEGDVHMSN